MTLEAQALPVVIRLGTTLPERHDVIDVLCRSHDASRSTLHTQRITPQMVRTYAHTSATTDALGHVKVRISNVGVLPVSTAPALSR